MPSGLIRGLQHRRAWVERMLHVTSRAALGAMSHLHGFVTAKGRGLHHVVDEVLSAAAHELKTPLSVLGAEAQLLARERGGDARLANITRQVDRLTHVVQQLLEAARVPFGAAPTAVDVVDLMRVVGQVVRRFERSARHHRLRFTSAGPSPVWVRVDPERIGLALANLIDNAVRFSPSGGAVDVAVRRASGEVLVSVRDRGVGIPLERQRNLFEFLYRAHAGTPDDHGGIGIGLAITRQIVTAHGGAVWFKSAAGRGSTFAFSLPLA